MKSLKINNRGRKHPEEVKTIQSVTVIKQLSIVFKEQVDENELGINGTKRKGMEKN